MTIVHIQTSGADHDVQEPHRSPEDSSNPDTPDMKGLLADIALLALAPPTAELPPKTLDEALGRQQARKVGAYFTPQLVRNPAPKPGLTEL